MIVLSPGGFLTYLQATVLAIGLHSRHLPTPNAPQYPSEPDPLTVKLDAAFPFSKLLFVRPRTIQGHGATAALIQILGTE